MIHYGEFDIDSNSVSAKTAVDWNEMCNRTMLDIYVNACYQSPGFKGYGKMRIQNALDKKMRMKQEWYLPAKEAARHGFVDGVIDE